ncbi:WLM-domain-containing protein [Saccharata proteae CBS 121410]|uniref:WLM-domain-containing protein n=1 Tax=Saccharata proteae CBS 121410 TaxID=1314787 RepID=A0A9P4HS03_9PEZI|nr:WLM-domain-containing protein [Saccharata proteae CBS 121410]
MASTDERPTPTSDDVPAHDTSDATASNDDLSITLTHHGKPHTFTFPSSATISDLSARIASELSVQPANQKLLVTPKPGLLRPPFKDPSLPLSTISTRKTTLMGSTTAEISTLQTSASEAQAELSRRQNRFRNGPVKPATPARTTGRGLKAQEEATYTFQTLRPLPYLPHPERSLAYLERLRDDPGIRTAMRTHKFSVPLLTEMNPAEHTTHESKTLGLNRNRGEVIELRLRTDAYDGYRDYKTIRRTLCHELAHNVWGEHDRNFWNLCAAIEKEVERADWTRGGRTVGEEEFYEGPAGREEEEVYDHGGWSGGEFVLGGAGSGGSASVVSSAGGTVDTGSLSRREILARAAEERMKRTKQVEKSAEHGDGASGSS